MKVKINSFNDFVSFCQLIKCLRKLSKDSSGHLKCNISNLIEDLNNSFVEALAQNSDFSDFYKKNNFNLIDLDLLQISLFERTIVITPELYLDKCIFKLFDGMTVFQLLPKLRSAEIIKRNILVLEKSDDVNESILNLIAYSVENNNENNEFEIESNLSKYNTLKELTLDLELLSLFSEIKENKIIGLTEHKLNLLWNSLFKMVVEKFNLTLKDREIPFVNFLLKNQISFEELIFLYAKLWYYTKFNFWFKFYYKIIADNYSVGDSLLKKKLIYFNENSKLVIVNPIRDFLLDSIGVVY